MNLNNEVFNKILEETQELTRRLENLRTDLVFDCSDELNNLASNDADFYLLYSSAISYLALANYNLTTMKMKIKERIK